RMRAAGCQVELEIWPRMPHTWQVWARVLPEARAAIERIGAFVQRAADAAHLAGLGAGPSRSASSHRAHRSLRAEQGRAASGPLDGRRNSGSPPMLSWRTSSNGATPASRVGS